VSAQMSERDEVTLRVLALLDETTVAEQRRRAVRVYAAQARRQPDVAEIVRLILSSRRSRSTSRGNVITLRGTR
jgi:hypothetical protein